MRIDVKKMLFVGVKKDKDIFFQKAQKAGIVEFIDFESKIPYRELPDSIQELKAAIKILRGLPTKEQEEIDDLSIAGSTARCIIKLNYSQESLHEEQRLLVQEISRIEVFGDFWKEDIEFLQKEGKRVIQFFFTKEDAEVEAKELPEVIYVGSNHGLDYFSTINKEPTNYQGMTEMVVNRTIGELEQRLDTVKEELVCVERELKILVVRNDFLHEAFIDKLNGHNLSIAKGYVETVMGDSLFAVEGWVADCDLQKVQALLDETNIHGEEVVIEEEDKVPTHLRNKGLSLIGEDLVHIYDTPSVEDKDPSLWVLGGFALFFAIIIGDGGYGLIFLALSLFLRMKFPSLEGVGKRALNLFTILSVSCIMWGVLSNSFFGIKFEPDSAFRKVSVVQWLVEKKTAYHINQQDDTFGGIIADFPSLASVNDPLEFLKGGVRIVDGKASYVVLDKFSTNVMLELALVIGIIHIGLSFLRGFSGSWAGIGWIIVMIGGYLNFPSVLQATSMLHYLFYVDPVEGAKIGQELMYSGVGLAVVLALIQHKLMGTLEIINVIQVFADVLSYLRLYALGMAGAMMSATFNDIAGSLSITFGVIVLIIGHIVNIALSAIGGLIHGLRLHFIEWYHYSFEGGGRVHQPLKLLNIK
ncbi:MAG: V/A-type H+-transporting ATPase subunit I [Chlamydiales bacterium]|jgi:V/A-type H+-transporting ATPase subunit I